MISLNASVNPSEQSYCNIFLIFSTVKDYFAVFESNNEAKPMAENDYPGATI